MPKTYILLVEALWLPKAQSDDNRELCLCLLIMSPLGALITLYAETNKSIGYWSKSEQSSRC